MEEEEDDQNWWEMDVLKIWDGKAAEGMDKNDKRPANRELHLLSPVFSQVAYIGNLDAEAQRALILVFWRWGLNELARIMPVPQRYHTGSAIARRRNLREHVENLREHVEIFVSLKHVCCNLREHVEKRCHVADMQGALSKYTSKCCRSVESEEGRQVGTGTDAARRVKARHVR